jgi:hypothetical protein
MGKLDAKQRKWLAELGAMVGDAGTAGAAAVAADPRPRGAQAAAQREAERARRRRGRALDDIESEIRLLRRSFR